MKDEGFEHESISQVTHNKSVQATATALGSYLASGSFTIRASSVPSCQWLSPDLGR
jgi:hypothetical protein